MLKVCLFGKYDPQYHRYRVLKKGMSSCGIPFVECQTGKSFGSSFRISLFILENLELVRKFLGLKKDFSHIIVCTDLFHVPFVYLYSRISRKKFIFDPIASWYAIEVYERGSMKKSSMKAQLLRLYERTGFLMPDRILATTEDFKRFWVKMLSIPPERISVLPVGGEVADETSERNEKSEDGFRVTYWGNFLPQHGLECVMHAAKILEKQMGIIFVMIGSGFAWKKIREMSRSMSLSNVKFTGHLQTEEFRQEVSRADVGLGFFRKGGRAPLLIGNKVFEGLSLKKVVITGNYPPIKRYFSHRETLYMVEPGNPKDLAKAILELKNNPALRQRIAQNGYDYLRREFSEERIGERLKTILQTV